ncbi:Uncharacterised protein [Mycobacteroides abscessus subsp. abscessus]|nr:Uncharacterised protein [Mycobacteroides abscessus subsp. abscessus]
MAGRAAGDDGVPCRLRTGIAQGRPDARGGFRGQVTLGGVVRQVTDIAPHLFERGVLTCDGRIVADASAQPGGRGVVEQPGLQVGELLEGDGLIGLFVVHLPKPNPAAAQTRGTSSPVRGAETSRDPPPSVGEMCQRLGELRAGP